MTERRTLIVLLLLVLTAALYIWGMQSNHPAEAEKSAEEVEAAERAKAEPFPAPAAK